MKERIHSLIEHLENGAAVVKASIARSNGSTPRTAGAIMLVFENPTPNGIIAGTIGGGQLEGKTIQEAKKVLVNKKGMFLPFRLDNTDAALQGMICGGTADIYIDYIAATKENIQYYKEVLNALSSGKSFALITEINTNTNNIIGRNILPKNTPSEEILPKDFHGLIKNFPNLTLCLAQNEIAILIEPFTKPQTLHFIGAGHVAKATAKLAAMFDFLVHVSDDREEFAHKNHFPDAQKIDVLKNLQDLSFDENTTDYIIIMTRGHIHDKEVLVQALKTSAPYIGMIGSRTKRDATYALLRKEGFTDKDFERIYCPIGINIHAETPEEIGLSIVAELISCRAKK